jgi:hypothetical protein
LTGKINELETNSKKRYVRDFYRGVKTLRKGRRPATNVVKDDEGMACRLSPYSEQVEESRLSLIECDWSY